jgi:putative endonuclease
MKLKYSPKRRIGNKAEDLTVTFLYNLGHVILFRNFLKRIGEIDIITNMNGVYHFIEVKSVTHETPWNVIHETNANYRVEDQITRKKLNKIYKTARIYLLDNHLNDVEFQIDLVTVIFYKSGDIPRLDFIENIS